MKDIFKTVQLVEPIDYENNGVKASITEVNIQKLKGKHYKFIPDEIFNGEEVKNPVKYFELIASLTGLEISQIEELGYKDITTLINTVGELVGE